MIVRRYVTVSAFKRIQGCRQVCDSVRFQLHVDSSVDCHLSLLGFLLAAGATSLFLHIICNLHLSQNIVSFWKRHPWVFRYEVWWYSKFKFFVTLFWQVTEFTPFLQGLSWLKCHLWNFSNRLSKLGVYWLMTIGSFNWLLCGRHMTLTYRPVIWHTGGSCKNLRSVTSTWHILLN